MDVISYVLSLAKLTSYLTTFLKRVLLLDGDHLR